MKREDGPSAAVRIRVMKRDRFSCTYCGVSGTEAELEIDHIIAIAKGGSHHISNLTTSCRACNQDKGTKTMRPMRQERHASASHPLVGMYLHTFDDQGWLQLQGHILAVDGEVVLAQLFEWMMGEATQIEKFEKSFIYSKQCALYPDDETWRSEYGKINRREAILREQKKLAV